MCIRDRSYDSLLRIELPEQSMLVGYPDDVPLKNVELAQLQLNRVMRAVDVWRTTVSR